MMFSTRAVHVSALTSLFMISGCTTTEILNRAAGKKDDVFLSVRAVTHAYKSAGGAEAVFCLTTFDPGTGEEHERALHVPLKDPMNDKDKWEVKPLERLDKKIITMIRYRPTSKDLSLRCSPTQNEIPVLQLPNESFSRRIRAIQGGRVEEHVQGRDMGFVEERYPKQMASIAYVSPKPILDDGHVIDIFLERKFPTEAKPEPKPYLYALLPFSVVLDAVGYVVAIPVIAILALTQKIAGP